MSRASKDGTGTYLLDCIRHTGVLSCSEPPCGVQAGGRYVPLLRISILQLEMVLQALLDGTGIQQPSSKVINEMDKASVASQKVNVALNHVVLYTHKFNSGSLDMYL